MDVSIKILRYDPESDRKGHWENYVVDAEPEERILDLLHKINGLKMDHFLLENLVHMEYAGLMQWLSMEKTCWHAKF